MTMTAPTSERAPENHQQSIVAFFQRLDSMGGLLRAVTGERVSMVMEFRPSGERVVLDPTTDPVRIETGGPAVDGTVSMAGTPEDLHNMLIGKEPAARQMDQRRLLLKGGMLQMSRFFPFMDLTPALYASHLRSAPNGGPNKSRPSLFQRFLGFFSFLSGLVLGRFRRPNFLRVMSAMSRGMLRALKLKGPASSPARPTGPAHPLEPPRPGLIKRIFLKIISANAFVGGYFMGFLKHRLKMKFDLFAVMARMSKGIDRAARAQ